MYVISHERVCRWDGACYSDAQLVASGRSDRGSSSVVGATGNAAVQASTSSASSPELTPEADHAAAAETLLQSSSDAFASTIADKAAIVASHVVMSRSASVTETPMQPGSSSEVAEADAVDQDGAAPAAGL